MLVAAGAVGLGGARSAATGSAGSGPATTALTLYGRQFHLHSPTRLPGQLPEKGDRHSAYAELVDRVYEVVGEFRNTPAAQLLALFHRVDPAAASPLPELRLTQVPLPGV